MKKLLFSFVFAGSTAMCFGQQSNVDFESLNLAQVDTFYNGSDFAGEFVVNIPSGNNVHFSNYFDNTWGPYWTGFSYSNMTDITTAGSSNQYSSFVGAGAIGSQKYGVYYPDGMISFTQNTQVDSIKITNTTYAALSMRDGDTYGKKFGSVNDANGVADGTNGNDYFKIWIYALDKDTNTIDSMEFYLADFRFPNSSQDYILNTWTNVDLSSFGPFVRHLTFKFESSDMSFGFINTPTYFALDELHFSNVLGVREILENAFEIYPNPVQDELIVKGFQGKLTVKNIEGKTLVSQEHSGLSKLDVSNLNKGIYLVTVQDGDKVSTQKIVK